MVEIREVLSFWAKKSEENEQHYYPLLYHMLDTTAVCREIWEKCLLQSARQFIAHELQLSDDSAARWIAFWVGLHDIGKASPDFQGKSPAVQHELEQAGFKFNRKPDTYHGTASACILQELFQPSLAPDLAKKISVIVGGHHGKFPRSEELKLTRRCLGDGPWDNARSELYKHMIELCDMRDAPLPTGTPGNPFLMILAGLTSVADWIASNEDCFPYEVYHDIAAHPGYARDRGLKALKALGWTGWNPPSSPADTIERLFPFISDVRPLQREVMSLAKACSHQPGLVIIEAPMGEGKTEAATYLADSWVANLKQKGYYFALPTMATSDQMFGRVEKYLEKRYPNGRVNFMLLHGHAALSAEFETLRDRFEVRNPDADGKESHDKASAGVVASEWFTYRKRGLLAPFGVGTIDQALLAVLQTRHVFVRLFGLAHKTIIIDEIHAYDAYMSTLLERLLEWLAALSSSVVLLSATLPKQRKNALLQAYQKGLTGRGNMPEVINDARYPRISWSIGSDVNAIPVETSRGSQKVLRLQWVSGEIPEGNTEFGLGKRLRETLRDNGCVAVICNTVDQAQKTYWALKQYFPGLDAGDGYPELDILHARYLYGNRQERETRTLRRFGKNGTVRPKQAVLVATQVIEQSLDLDFDLMITDMAPVDLLLQRAGRLHRHHERDNNRPERVKEPTLWIIEPAMQHGIPNFGGGTEAVYDYHILLRSWLAVNRFTGQEPVRIPDDIEGLIEEVYGDRKCPAELPEEFKTKWEESWGEVKANIEYERSEAENRYIKRPSFSGQLGHMTDESLEEDNPEFHKAHQALTRLTGLTVNVLCLSGNDIQLYLDSTSLKFLDKRVRPPRDLVKELLMHSVPVSHRGLVEKIIEGDQKVPQAWREEPLLRHHYYMCFDENNRCQFKGYVLELDLERGLLIEKVKRSDHV